jgi:hypothetical protein
MLPSLDPNAPEPFEVLSMLLSSLLLIGQSSQVGWTHRKSKMFRTDSASQLLQNLEEIRKLRNQLMHDGFKEISGPERAQVMKVWFGKQTFKKFYEKAPPAISPLIELLKERIYVLNDLDC